MLHYLRLFFATVDGRWRVTIINEEKESVVRRRKKALSSSLLHFCALFRLCFAISWLVSMRFSFRQGRARKKKKEAFRGMLQEEEALLILQCVVYGCEKEMRIGKINVPKDRKIRLGREREKERNEEKGLKRRPWWRKRGRTRTKGQRHFTFPAFHKRELETPSFWKSKRKAEGFNALSLHYITHSQGERKGLKGGGKRKGVKKWTNIFHW